MFFTEDGGRAHMVASLFIDIFRSAHRRRIRFLMAVMVSISSPSFLLQAYRNQLAKVGYAAAKRFDPDQYSKPENEVKIEWLQKKSERLGQSCPASLNRFVKQRII